MNQQGLRYKAFITYSHADDRVAGRLHRRLESYRIPKAVRREHAELPVRINPVFRDREELASSVTLSAAIEAALDDSEALIVVCSPAAVASRWVGEEIRYFRTRHPDRPVLAFVVGGEPSADPRAQPARAAFPVALIANEVDDTAAGVFDPLAADARDAGDGFQAAFIKLAAGLLNIGFDELHHRDLRRKHRRWAALATLMSAVSVAFALLALLAMEARDEARVAQRTAELELTSEQQTRSFLLSVFRLANPGVAGAETATVREVLDRAVATIDATDFARPVIKSRLLATMGQAYSSLGLNQRSTELLGRSLELLPAHEESPESRRQRIDSQTELADVLFDMGDYEAALAALESVEPGGVALDSIEAAQRARVANVRGDILAYLDREPEAREAYDQALAAIDAVTLSAEIDASIRSRSLGGIALLSFFAGDSPAAVDYFAEAVDILVPVFGHAHPDTIWAIGSLGSAAKHAGDLERARSSWAQALAHAESVYDPGNPGIGTLKQNLARLLLETDELAEAEGLLRDALASDRAHRHQDFDGLVYTLNNLALVRIARGDLTEPVGYLEEAQRIATATNHELTGPVTINLADVYCLTGRVGEGLELAHNGLDATLAEFGEDDWRGARAELTLNFCRSLDPGSPRPDAAALERLNRAILARWGEANLYSRRAREQLNAMS